MVVNVHAKYVKILALMVPEICRGPYHLLQFNTSNLPRIHTFLRSRTHYIWTAHCSKFEMKLSRQPIAISHYNKLYILDSQLAMY